MSSLTGLASASITSMIPGLCAAGQMKLVTMVQRSGSATNASSPALPNITIPALTGSQIAIVYLETRTISYSPAGYPFLGSVSGTGTGVNITASFASQGNASAQVHDPFLNSAVCTTSTGSQTVTFSTSIDQSAIAGLARIDFQACVFIYSPPF